MPHQVPTEEQETDQEGATYSWDTVIACGVALLLQSRRDNTLVQGLLERGTGPNREDEATGELWAYVQRILEPMR